MIARGPGGCQPRIRLKRAKGMRAADGYRAFHFEAYPARAFLPADRKAVRPGPGASSVSWLNCCQEGNEKDAGIVNPHAFADNA